MDTKRELRERLTSRRARITPGQAGLRTFGTGSRRVPGPRREEVAASSASIHPLVGELSLTFETLELVADPGLTMFVYTAEPGSRSAEALGLLASWAATPDEESTHADHEEQPGHRSRAE